MSKKRATHCFVPGCNTKYRNDKLSIFSVPKNEALLEKWKRLIPRSDNELTTESAICELHFQEDFINRNYVHVINGETVTFPRGKPILKSDAIPTIFPNFPRILPVPNVISITIPKKRKSSESTSSLEGMGVVEDPLATSKYSKPVRNVISITIPKKRKSRECTSSLDEDNLRMVVVEDPLATSKYSKISITLNDLRNIKLPTEFWAVTIPANDINSLIFHVSILQFLNNYPTLITERMVIVKDEDSKLKCEVFLKGLKVGGYPDISSKDMLESILTEVNLHKICVGAGSVQEFRHLSNLLKQNEIYEGQIFSAKCPRKCTVDICICCKYLCKLMIHKSMRVKHKIKDVHDPIMVYYLNTPFR